MLQTKEKRIIAFKERDEFVKNAKKVFPIIWRKCSDLGVWAGWHPLVWNLSSVIEKELNTIKRSYLLEELPCFLQIKEKFGQLNIYTKKTSVNFPFSIDKKIENCISNAMKYSILFCEYCGKDGELRSNHPNGQPRFWVKTMCVNCWKKDQ